MQVSTKGQVTIPREIRNQLGLLPRTQVEFELAKDHARIRKASRTAAPGQEGAPGARNPARYSGNWHEHQRNHGIDARRGADSQETQVTPATLDLVSRLRNCRGVLVDSNILLDIATNDARWSDWSGGTLAECAELSTLVINPIVYAEVSIALRPSIPSSMPRCRSPYDHRSQTRHCLSPEADALRNGFLPQHSRSEWSGEVPDP
jgi:AbrB family looped-hinge helix DNA binding protein